MIVAKSVEKKGNWAEVVPMALYSLDPHRVHLQDFHPSCKHGWEPVTPIQLLYKGWIQQILENIDLEQWVIENSERIQNPREKARLTTRSVQE